MSQTPETPVVGFVGLGTIGQPITERIRDRGFRMIVHDILPERTAGFPETAGSAAEMASRSEIVFACLPQIASYRSAALGEEGLVLGAKAGLTPAQMLEMLNEGTGQNSATLTKVPYHIFTRRFDYGGSMQITLKDTLAFLEEAESLGVETPVRKAVRQVYLAAAAAGAKDGDMTEMIRHMEAQTGVEVS